MMRAEAALGQRGSGKGGASLGEVRAIGKLCRLRLACLPTREGGRWVKEEITSRIKIKIEVKTRRERQRNVHCTMR
jgi:hypothetical protein